MGNPSHQYEMLTDESTCTVDRSYASRFSFAVLRATYLTGPVLVVLALTLFAAVVGCRIVIPTADSWVWLTPSAGIAALYSGLVAVTFSGLRTQSLTVLPVDSVLSARFGAESFWERTPRGESIMRYDTYDRVWIRGGFLVFGLRRGTPANALPLALIPDGAWLVYIESQLAPRRS